MLSKKLKAIRWDRNLENNYNNKHYTNERMKKKYNNFQNESDRRVVIKENSSHRKENQCEKTNAYDENIIKLKNQIIEKFGKEIVDKNEAIRILKEEKDSLFNAENKIKNEYSKLENENIALKTNLEDLKSSHLKLQEEINSLKESKNQLKNQQITKLQAYLNETNKELEILNSEKESWSDTVQQISSQNLNLKKSLDDLKNDYQRLKEENNSLIDSKNQLIHYINENRPEREILNQKIDSLVKAEDELRNKYTELEESLRDTFKKLKDENSSLMESKIQLEKQNFILTKENEHAIQTISEFQNEIERKNNEIVNLHGRKELLSIKQRQSEDQLIALESDNQDLRKMQNIFLDKLKTENENIKVIFKENKPYIDKGGYKNLMKTK